MKTIQTTILILLSFLFFKCAKEPVQQVPSETADETFDLSKGKQKLEDWNRANVVFPGKDDKYFVAGSRNFSFGNILVAFDKNRMPDAELSPADPIPSGEIQMVQLSTGKILVFVSRQRNNQEPAKLKVYQTTDNLEVLYEREQDLVGDLDLSGILETSRGNCLINGEINDNGSVPTNVFVGHFDLNDTILNTHIIDNGLQESPSKMIARAGNYFFFSSNFQASNADLFAVTIDEAGNLIRTDLIGTTDIDIRPPSIEKGTSDAIYHGKTAGLDGGGNLQVRVAKYDKDLNQLWSDNIGGNNSEVLKDILVGKDGNLYLLGTSNSYGNGQRDIYLKKIDPDGNRIWHHTYGTSNDENVYNMIQQSTGDCIILANSRTNIGLEYFLLHLNEEGIPIE